MQVLTGDMLLAAAFVSYAGPFTSKFRSQLIKEWIKFLTDKGAPTTAGISDPLKVLVDDATVASWVREGLPSDPTSMQNGTILTNSERWPLMMDPQLQVSSHCCAAKAPDQLCCIRGRTQSRCTSALHLLHCLTLRAVTEATALTATQSAFVLGVAQAPISLQTCFASSQIGVRPHALLLCCAH